MYLLLSQAAWLIVSSFLQAARWQDFERFAIAHAKVTRAGGAQSVARGMRPATTAQRSTGYDPTASTPQTHTSTTTTTTQKNSSTATAESGTAHDSTASATAQSRQYRSAATTAQTSRHYNSSAASTTTAQSLDDSNLMSQRDAAALEVLHCQSVVDESRSYIHSWLQFLRR